MAECIVQWNAHAGNALGAKVELVKWETHSTPDMSGSPQHVLNQQIVDDCDLGVAVFWSRLGTPTENHESGSIEEIERIRKSGKKALVYFCSRPIPQDALKGDQFSRLQKIKEDFQKRGLLGSYSDTDDLCRQFQSHLTKVISELKNNGDIFQDKKDDEVIRFIYEIAPFIFDLIIFGEQEKDRSINPWVSRLESRYSEISNELRRLSIQDVAIQKGWTAFLNELANSIDNFVNMEDSLYCGLTEDIKDAVEKAKHLKVSIIDPFFASQRAPLTLKKDFAMQLRMLKSLNDRAEMMLNEGKIEELQGKVSEIGHDLLILSMYNTEDFPKAIKGKLYSISREIHLMETKRNNHSFDRQESFRNRLNELSGQLNALAVELPIVTREN